MLPLQNAKETLPFWKLEIALLFSKTSKLFLFHKIKPQRFEDESEDMRLECSSEEPGLQENQTRRGSF